MAIVYTYNENDLSLFTMLVYQGLVGGKKWTKICLRSC